MSTFCDMAYTWDANNNKTSESITGVMSGYGFTAAGTTYDFEDRLTGFSRAATSGPALLSQSWSLTAVGDWTSVTTNGTAQNRTHGPTHELLTAGGQNVATDVKGNITTLPANLRLAGATTAMNLHANGTADVNFQYDALGRRVARSGTGGSVVYVQMDQQTIADYPVGGAATTPTFRYVYASYIDEPVVRKTAGTGETLVYFHRNQHYSVTAITTSTGAIAERYAYTAYGQPTTLDASGTVLQTSNFSLRYSFTGREWDATLGLHHFRARWMSPSAGRFLGRDPIGYEGSEWGLYEYCRNSPLIYLDPGGEILWAIPVAWPAIPAVNAAVAAAVAAAGYTLVECMSNPVCVMAVPAAIAQALANLTGAARIALVAGCQAAHGAYKVAEAACKLNRECIEQPAGHCLLKLVRCYDATRNLACWTGVWKLRLAYIASGCDFAIPTRANHPKAVVFANNKAIECANSILNNCFGEVAY